jgi:hypothetical protein
MPGEHDLSKLEYKDLSDNLRHWNTLRFAELTIFLASTGGLLTVYFRGDPPPAPVGTIIKVAGLVIAAMFWILQERTMMWFFNFLRRARELEAELGFQQYLSSPRGQVITGRNAIRMFFVTMILFWGSLLVWFPY